MGPQTKVLLVDDDPDFVKAAKAMLETKPYKVIVAYDGKEGLAKARSENPDVIILDVMMPPPDGYAVCADLKRDPKYRKIPIILLTAVMQALPHTLYTIEKGLRTEADDTIDKPVKPEELIRRLEALIGAETKIP
jgi:two-component system alkaline phosphatase synthesis response regulator PhoP